MDPESPIINRVERTFWTVWSFITGAVNRLLRSEPANTDSKDSNSLQESTVDAELAECSCEGVEADVREADEEQPVTTTSLLSSSRPAVAWELCTREIDFGPDEDSKRFETKKESERDVDTKDEEVSKMGNESGLIVKDEEKNHDLLTLEQDEMPKNEESGECLHMRSQIHMDDAMCENVSGAKGETEREMSLDVQQIVEEAQSRIQSKVEDDEHEVEDDKQKKSCTITEKASMHIEELSMQKNETDILKNHEEVESSNGVLMPASEKEKESDVGAVQIKKQLSAQKTFSNDDLLVASNKSITVHEDELVATGEEHVITPRNESDKSEDVKEEDEHSVDEKDLAAVIQEEDETKTENNQALREVLEQEENSQTVPGGSQEDRSSNDQIIEFVLNAQIEPHTNENQEEVAEDASVQTRLIETDCRETESYEILTNVGVTSSDYSAFERFLDEYEEQEDMKVSNFGKAHTASSVTVKPDVETGQEQSGELEKTPEGILEGHSVVWEELNPPSCEEVQEGFPEYNNQSRPDENTTQRFLEVGDSKEVQTTQLPEEVESRGTESLQNSGCSAEVDCLLVQEHMKDIQEKKENSKSNFDLVGAGLTQEPVESSIEQLLQEKGPFSAEEDQKSMVTSMKTGVEPAEEESVSENKKDLQNEELLVEISEDPFGSKEVDAARDGFLAMEKMLVEETLKLLETEEQDTTETSLLEMADTVDLESRINRMSNLLEDISENVQKKAKSLEDIELQDAGKHLEATGLKAEVDADCGMHKSEVGNFDLQVAEMAPAITKEMSALISDLESTKDARSQEMNNQLSGFQETPDSEIMESKPKDVTMISTEEMLKHVVESEVTHGDETVCSSSGSQNHIDEEVLDLWIQTLSKDDEKHQIGTELGQQILADLELTKEKQREVEEELLVESNSGEYELVSDAEMSSSTAESGFSDQSLSELGAQNSEAQLLKSTSTGSIHGAYDVLVNASESGDISGQQVEQQNSVSEETTDVQKSLLKDEGSLAGYNLEERDLGVMSQEWDQTQEKSYESHREIDDKEPDLSRKADFKITEDLSLTGDSQEALIKIKSLDITPPEAEEDALQTESAQSVSSSDASSEEGVLLAESDSGDDTLAKQDETPLKLPSLEKTQLGWSKDITDSVPGPDRAEVEEQLKLESEDQTEEDTSMLDFRLQRSRIAVKNPRVRRPKDPRSLLLMPSVDPTPAPRLPVKVPAGVPLGGMGIGIKLPGLGAGFPGLKKTQHVVKDEDSSEDDPQEPETKTEEKNDSAKQDETQHRPKWMPPKHPGFGNPLMSELKTKLKKTTKD